MSVLNNLCDFCKADIIKGLPLGQEYFCKYECYDRMYSLEEEEQE